ncbi:MAG: O-antigen ligase family protein [Nitrospinae bacterium]|nr:O-antigen ligase family protein [Nitrospinota bacterium]
MLVIDSTHRWTPALDRVLTISLILFVVFSMFSISITQIAFAIGTVAWLTKVSLTQSWKRVRFPLGIPFLLFIVACILAVVTAVDPGYSVKPLKKLLQILIFFWAVNSIRDERQRDFLVLLLVVAGCAAASYGIYQGLLTPVTTATRVEGTMSIYMTFAGILMLVGLVALGRFLLRKPRENWLGVAVLLIIVCLLLTLTRQAWLGFLTGLIFLVFVWKTRLLWGIPILLVLALLFAPAGVKERMHSMVDLTDWTLQSRLALWQGGWQVFKDYPLTGCGFRCMDLVHTNYPDPTGYIKKYRGMHNNFVQLAVDTGLLGLTAWMSIWACYFLALFKRARGPGENSSPRWVIHGSAAAVLGFLAGGFFEVNFYDSEVAMLLYFIMALPFAAEKSDKETLAKN